MKNPPKDLRNHLSAAGLSLTTGTNLFPGLRRAVSSGIPTNAVFVSGAPGPTPTRVMGEGEEVITTVVIVVLRWNDWNDGDTKMRDIRDQIQGQTVSGYLDVFAQDTEPTDLGQDEDGNHMFHLGVEMTFIQAKV